MELKPLTLKQANELVATLHRHHKPVVSHRFSLGAFRNDTLVGAVIVGRPVARKLDAYNIAEVTRLVTDGSKNACSFLYSAAARVAREMGFIRIQTYILAEESGVSLDASGWQFLKVCGGGNWASNRKRREDQPQGKKKLYIKVFKRSA